MSETPYYDDIPYPTAEPELELENLKVPPHSLKAEQAVIGGLLIANRHFDSVADVVSTDDFYRKEHQLIFSVMSQLAEAGNPLDAVTVSETLHNLNELENCGGLAYLAEMAENTQAPRTFAPTPRLLVRKPPPAA